MVPDEPVLAPAPVSPGMAGNALQPVTTINTAVREGERQPAPSALVLHTRFHLSSPP